MSDLEYKQKFLQSNSIHDKIEYLNMIISPNILKELYLRTNTPYLKRHIIKLARNGDIYNLGLKETDDSIRIEVIRCIHSDLKAKWALEDIKDENKKIKEIRKSRERVGNTEIQKKKEKDKKPKIVLAKIPKEEKVKEPEKVCTVTASEIRSTEVPYNFISVAEEPTEEIKKQMKPIEEKAVEVQEEPTEEIIKVADESTTEIIFIPLEKVGLGSGAKIVEITKTVEPLPQVEPIEVITPVEIKLEETNTAPVEKKKRVNPKRLLQEEAVNNVKVIRRPRKEDLLEASDSTITNKEVEKKVVEIVEESILEKQSKEMLANMLPEQYLANIFDITFLTRLRNKIQKRIDLLETNHSLLKAINKRKIS
jgi:hypothetical protein